MIYNLFIVKSPLQLINSIEAISHFKLKNNVVVLLNDGSELNTKQMEKLLTWHDWKKIIRVKDNKKSKFFKYIKLIKELKKHQYNYMFFGEFGSIHKAIIPNVKKEKLFYLDDGFGTYYDYNEIILTKKYNKFSLRQLRFALFGYKIKIKESINLFTYFGDIKSSNRLVVKNSLNYLKTNFLSNIKTTDEVIFLGQPIENLIDDETYIRFVKAIIKKYKDRNITYMPHRGETKEQIQKVKSLQNNYFKFRENSIPIELYFLEKKFIPNTVLSFCSTAMTTLNIIYDIPNILSIEIPKDLMSHKENYELILKTYYSKLNQNQILKFEDLSF